MENIKVDSKLISSADARRDFIKKRKEELNKTAEHIQVLPTKKIYTNYIDSNAECLMYYDQGGINLDCDEFYSLLISSMDLKRQSAADFLSIITEVMNDYFGPKIPSEEEYRKFTRNRDLNISDFEGTNMASSFERALVTFNSLKLLGANAYLIFSNNKPYVAFESPYGQNDRCYTLFDPSVYSVVRHPQKQDTAAPHTAPVSVKDFDEILYGNDKNFAFDARGSLEGVISLSGSKIDDVPGYGRIDIKSLGLPREQTMFR